jgi:3-isopropylmalate/(R)-2-methylmalate dehydratase large subunit
MGLTITEKILARASGRAKVAPGEVIRAKPCFSTSNDYYTFPHWAERLDRIGVKQLHSPEKIAVVADHFCPTVNEVWAERHHGLRQWANRFGVGFLYYGEGIGHQIMAEKGHALPGTFLVSDDSDCTCLGGVGCLCFGIGTSILEAYAAGDLWIRVPATIRIELEGYLKRGVTARDVSQRVMGDLGKDGALNAVVEFGGPAVAGLSIDQRMTLCSRVISTGADTAIVPPDERAIGYAGARARVAFDPVKSDSDAVYLRALRYDLSEIEPLVAVSPDPVCGMTVSAMPETVIDQAYIGSCAGGRLDELRGAAEILRNRKVHPRVKLIVVPPSREVLAALGEEGLLNVLLDAGAMIGTPGCGACFGVHSGVLAGREVCIATVNNNLKGRMGSKDAEIHLASGLTVAASAVEGRIADPRDYL